MNNYEYIIACLPVPDPNTGTPDVDSLLDFIRSQCSEKDAGLVEFIQDAFNPEKLDVAFYTKAYASSNAFIREFLAYDMQLRNTKAEYLNKVLERPEGTDLITVKEEEFEDKAAVLAVLQQDDILARERGLDSLLWDKAEELTRMHIFDMDVILSTVARLLITARWTKLDPATGRELFRKLVQEIRNTR